MLHLLFRDIHTGTRLILGLCPASERWHYFVMISLIGWVQPWNQSCGITLIGTICISVEDYPYLINSNETKINTFIVDNLIGGVIEYVCIQSDIKFVIWYAANFCPLVVELMEDIEMALPIVYSFWSLLLRNCTATTTYLFVFQAIHFFILTEIIIYSDGCNRWTMRRFTFILSACHTYMY